MKKNPWLQIPHTDYEDHMSEVGQARVLSELTHYSLQKYQPERFVLLGCATGNGLEHLNPSTTKKVYAIDINKDYLHQTKHRFEKQIPGLEVLNTDIDQEDLSIKDIDLFFAGLVLEYVEATLAVAKIIDTLRKGGILFIVVQKTTASSFVSNTKYHSLQTLAAISNEVDVNEIDEIIRQKSMLLLKQEEIPLKPGKSFVVLEYRKAE